MRVGQAGTWTKGANEAELSTLAREDQIEIGYLSCRRSSLVAAPYVHGRDIVAVAENIAVGGRGDDPDGLRTVAGVFYAGRVVLEVNVSECPARPTRDYDRTPLDPAKIERRMVRRSCRAGTGHQAEDQDHGDGLNCKRTPPPQSYGNHSATLPNSKLDREMPSQRSPPSASRRSAHRTECIRPALGHRRGGAAIGIDEILVVHVHWSGV